MKLAANTETIETLIGLTAEEIYGSDYEGPSELGPEYDGPPAGSAKAAKSFRRKFLRGDYKVPAAVKELAAKLTPVDEDEVF